MADHAANGHAAADGLKENAANVYNSVANGPVAQNVKDQTAKTTAELSNLANSRQTPSHPAATGQPLTHYHSFFSELLSWNNPRASAIAYASIVSLIFAARYLDVFRWAFKLTWMALAITITAEVAGKALVKKGFATQLRPRKYYTVPKETLDTVVGDVHELINFFVIESQRFLFAENIPASAAAAVGAYLSYHLAKIVPYWGLAVIATTVAFFAPLIYTTNQELIDSQLKHAYDVVEEQVGTVRTQASAYKGTVDDQLNQWLTKHNLQKETRWGNAPNPAEVKASDFPVAPKEDIKVTPAPAVKPEQEPLIAT